MIRYMHRIISHGSVLHQDLIKRRQIKDHQRDLDCDQPDNPRENRDNADAQNDQKHEHADHDIEDISWNGRTAAIEHLRISRDQILMKQLYKPVKSSDRSSKSITPR